MLMLDANVLSAMMGAEPVRTVADWILHRRYPATYS